MKKNLLFVVLFFSFLFSSGFSIDPEQTATVTSKDSATIEVKFNSPRLIISDERTSDAINDYLTNKNSTTYSIIDRVDEIIGVLHQDQERRYESAMDYMSRNSEISSTRINKVILERIRLEKIVFTILGILYAFLIISFVYIDKNRLITMNDRLAGVIYLTLFGIALYLIYCSILRIFTPIDFDYIKQINQTLG